MIGAEQAVQLLRLQQRLGQYQLTHGGPGVQCLGGNAGGIGVANPGHQRGDDADAVVQVPGALFDIGADILDAALVEHGAGGFQHFHGVQQVIDNQRLHGIELQLACLCSHGDGQVAGDHLVGRLVNSFRDHGIDFAGHNGRTRLPCRQRDFAEPGSWAAGQQPKVVAHFAELDGEALEYPREQHEGAHIGGGFHQVAGGHQRFAGDLRQVAHCQCLVAGRGVDASTNGGTAQVHLTQQQAGFVQAVDILAQIDGKGLEFLPQGHGHGVLQLGAPHFHHIGEFAAFGFQALLQPGDGPLQGAAANWTARHTAVG